MTIIMHVNKAHNHHIIYNQFKHAHLDREPFAC